MKKTVRYKPCRLMTVIGQIDPEVKFRTQCYNNGLLNGLRFVRILARKQNYSMLKSILNIEITRIKKETKIK